MKKRYTIPFSEYFINTIDSILEDVYSDYYPRESFFKFFYLIEKYSVYNKGEYAQMPISIIRKTLGTKRVNKKKIQIASYIISKSIECNIVISTEYHFGNNKKNKNKTRTYKFNNIFKDKYSEHLIDVEIDKDGYLELTKEHKRSNKEQPHLRLQYDLLKSKRVIFDYKLASKWINDRIDILSQNQYSTYTRMAINMLNKKIGVTEDKKSNRIFSNLTLIKREFRNFITIDGEKLLSIDLKSSQPYLLASKILKENQNCNECEDFFKLITEKDIYNTFRDKWFEINKTYNYIQYNSETYETEIKEISDRDESKKQFMRLLFKRAKGSVPFQIVLKEMFPKVYDIIKQMKKEAESKGIDNNLAVELQLEESNIFIPVINEVCKDGALSCHDSIYFKESLKERIFEILNNKFISLGYINYDLCIE